MPTFAANTFSMEVSLKRMGTGAHLRASNSQGQTADFDTPSGNGGMTPMEMLASSVAACSSLDLIPILEKQRQNLEDLEVKVTGERHAVNAANPFSNLHMHFILKGKVAPEKAEKAVALSVEKYCSVGESLDPNIKVTHSFEIVD